MSISYNYETQIIEDTITYNFNNNFIINVTQGDGAKIVHIMRGMNFQNKSYKNLAYLINKVLFIKK